MSNSTEQSKAHRLFFAKVTSRGVFDLQYSDYWDKKLGESGMEVIRRFIAEGLIEPAPIKVAIDKKFTVEELKPHMKERGLKVSGKKDELVERIMAADPVWVQEQTKNGELHQRTREGSLLADEIYTSIGTESGEMEARLTGLIHDKKYEDAYRTWAEWDAGQVFPRDELWGIDNTRNISPTFIQMARSIATKLPAGERERAILNELYGKGTHDPRELAARHGASYERELMELRKLPSAIGIRILPSPSPNLNCTKANDYAGCFKLEDAPDYPFGPCDNEPCCICSWTTVWADRLPEEGWKIPQRRHPMAGPHIVVPPEPFTEKTLRVVYDMVNPKLFANAEEKEKHIQIAMVNSGLRKPDEVIELPLGFARRVMENKIFGIVFVAAIVLVIWLVL